MKISRAFVALFALPAALSLAACGNGNANGVSITTSSTAYIRFINGVPGTNYDVYFTATGTTATTTAAYAGLNYGTATDFLAEPSTSATINVRTAGASGSATAAGGCTVPLLLSGSSYSIVIVNSGTPSCTLFVDNAYTAAGQYRFHNASQNATSALGAGSGAVAFGVTNGSVVPPGSGLPQATVAYVSGNLASFPGIVPAQTQFQIINPITQVAAVPPVTTAVPIGFAIGLTPPNGTATFAATSAIAASQIQSPLSGTTGLTFPDTVNTLPGGNYNNASLFIIDASGTPNYKLIGTFDNR